MRALGLNGRRGSGGGPQGVSSVDSTGQARQYRAVKQGPLPSSRRRGAGAALALPALGALALWMCAVPALAQSAVLSWTMPTPHAPNTFLTANVQHFAEDLSAASEGRIRIEARSGGRLLAHEDIDEAVRKGEFPIGEFVLSRLVSREPLFGADTVPFLVPGFRKAQWLWQASRAAIERRLEERNLVLLFAVPVSPPVLFTRNPLTGDATLRGLKLRVPAGGPRAELERFLAVSRRLGAEAVPVGEWSLSAAFEEGRLEAMFLPPSQALGLGGERFAPYYYRVHPWLRNSAVVLNRDVFEALDPALREILLDAARAAEERGWRISRDEAKRQIARMTQRGFFATQAPAPLWVDILKARRESTVEWTERTGEAGVAVIRAFYAPR